MGTGKRTAYDPKGRRKYLSRDEGRRFIGHAAKLLPKRRALFCLTLYYTGCRISEALSLTPASLDLQAKVLRIRCLKKRGRDETRRVPVPEFLIRALAELGEERPADHLWTFSRITGWRIIKEVMERAGITGTHATCKGLRHGFGVRGAMEQIPVSLIRDWMGHASSETTAIYLDVRDEEERELIIRTWD